MDVNEFWSLLGRLQPLEQGSPPVPALAGLTPDEVIEFERQLSAAAQARNTAAHQAQPVVDVAGDALEAAGGTAFEQVSGEPAPPTNLEGPRNRVVAEVLPPLPRREWLHVFPADYIGMDVPNRQDDPRQAWARVARHHLGLLLDVVRSKLKTTPPSLLDEDLEQMESARRDQQRTKARARQHSETSGRADAP